MEQGARSFVDYQISHEKDVLCPGPAFSLIQAFLELNNKSDERQIEVVIMSKNSAESSLRIFHSVEYYRLDITKAALTTGEAIAPYLKAYDVDLYLSFSDEDVKDALLSGVAAGLLLPFASGNTKNQRQIRIAFDGDAVLFSPEAEFIFQTEGKEAFCTSEKEKAEVPLKPGPFAHILRLIAEIQQDFEGEAPIRTALVTARSAPAHERVIRTLQSWGVRIDEAFFLGGMDKSRVLEAFGADIFFDDNEVNTESAAQFVLSARVPIVVLSTS